MVFECRILLQLNITTQDYVALQIKTFLKALYFIDYLTILDDTGKSIMTEFFFILSAFISAELL